MANIGGFETLEVWREARRLKLKIYKLIKTYAPEEKYELVSQTRRAARSIPANISEGHGRFYFKENIAFCRKSRGSLSELLNHLIDALDSG
jgi:four helix bundle protein